VPSLSSVLRDAWRSFMAQLLPLVLVFGGLQLVDALLRWIVDPPQEGFTWRDAVVFLFSVPLWVWVLAGLCRYAAEHTAGGTADFLGGVREAGPRFGRALRAHLTLTALPVACGAALFHVVDWEAPSLLALFAVIGGVLAVLVLNVFGGFCTYVAVLAPLDRPPIRTSFRLVATHFGRVLALYLITFGALFALLILSGALLIAGDVSTQPSLGAKLASGLVSAFVTPLVSLCFVHQYLAFPEVAAQVDADADASRA